MKSFVLFVTAFLSLSSAAVAGTETVSISVEILENYSAFSKKDVSDQNYQATTQNTKSRITISGTGILSSMNKTEEKTDNKVIGIDYKGHSYLKLEVDANQHVHVVVDVLIDDTINGIKFTLPMQYSAPAEFVSGSWQDYLAGKQVQVQLTEEGDKIAAEAIAGKLRASLNSVRDQISAMLTSAGAVVGEFATPEIIPGDGRTILKGDLDRMESTSGTGLKISFSFPITFSN